jgi:hypothetical protein
VQGPPSAPTGNDIGVLVEQPTNRQSRLPAPSPILTEYAMARG